MTTTAFYVYEHVRKDTGAVFYVGKGSGNRSTSSKDRNKYWHNIVNKAGGFSVNYVIKCVDEKTALAAEIKHIAQLKLHGTKLANMTNGGEGTSGYRFSEESKARMKEYRTGRKHSAEAREKIRLANTGVEFSEDRRNKISAKAKNRKMPEHVRTSLSERMVGFKHSEETKNKLRQINIGRKHTPEAIAKMSGDNNPAKRLDVRKKMSAALKGRVISAEQRIKLSAATKWRPKSEETKQKMRIAATKRTDQHKQKIAEANRNITPQRRKKLSDALKGRVFSEEHIEKLRQNAKNRPIVACPHCNKNGSRNSMLRHHFDNCKLKGSHMVDKPQTVVIDGNDYQIDALPENAKLFISHVADIDAQIAALKFQLDQKSVTRDAFFAMLKQALAEQPEAVQEAVVAE